jgi:hypothetical protein
MPKTNAHKLLNYCFAIIWLGNGLLCKVLDMVPRHSLIVARVLGDRHSGVITKLIGVSEILMAIWILSGYKPRLNAIVQILVITLMNMIEFLLASDLLLFGKFNAVLASILVLAIFYNTFVLLDKTTRMN